MKEYFKEQVEQRASELKSPEDMLSVGLLTLASYSSSARAQMFTQHIVQSWVLNNPEIPRVFTGYEQMFGTYSGSIKRAENKLKICNKIRKHGDYVYTLVVYNKSKNQYDIIQRNEVKNLAEIYGYKIDNHVIDSYDEGDTIKKDEVLYKSPSTDDYGNFMYGVNAKIAYVISSETIEDGITISESFAKKMSVTEVETCTVPINDNDIFLNLFGNKKEYKSFPDIGEFTKDSIICGLRRKDKVYDQYNLKNSNLRKIFPADAIYQMMGSWEVVDIDLWINKDIDTIPDVPAYAQLKQYATTINEYWQNVYDILGDIINNDENNYTQELSRLYAKARDYLDKTAKYAYEDRIFSNIVMEFTLAKSEPLHTGCKLCGRFGNKSVISNVKPDDEMGVTSDGIHPDIWVDALGVLGRLNSGQTFEQEICWITDKVEKDIRNHGDPTNDSVRKWQINYLLDYLKKVSKEQYKYTKESLQSKEDEIELIQEIINGSHINILQSPINSITGDDLYRLYNDYDMKKGYLYFKNPNGSYYKTLRTMIVADEYFLRLKQEPITKFSVRSASTMNPITGVPMKSLRNKKHKSLFQDQANKIGEQELLVFMLSDDPAPLSYFYRASSASVTGRRDETIYTEDPDNGFIINPKSNKSCSVDKFNALLKVPGFSLDIELDDYEDTLEEDIQKSLDPNIDEFPDYIKNMEYEDSN